ncbi:uncharacterized protein LOC104883507 [Beta vulgaris subsp. vulgaris]|uniref:uncharacterized protein LOC104883507 n=1 Tax=Beta vulgaris subsp. vulgaris TaxID=3555 RepID=UPI0025475BCB|nr:uncharacterized protein LOC104883507 [Beta vulgaris subsp. vulgaris]
MVPQPHGNDIDIYLQPLIDDLKIMWEKGVEVFDAHRQEKFNLRAMLFCTIQDYPAYGNLSGYTVKGKAFDGEQVFERHPKISTGEEVFAKIKDFQITFGKRNKKDLPTQGYKKCSNLWRLPYWRLLFVRHSLDIMHIEKNVCDSLIGTLLNIPGKTKDDPNARDDLKQMKIRTELHPVKKEDRNFLPPAAYTLSRKEKKQFCECLAGVKVPQGYSSNIHSLVSMENLKLVGLKSHDCHVLMQHLLPVALRGILPKNVRVSITRLCSFFHAIYNKVIDPKDLDDLESEIVVILCQLEMYFPPSFFDVMIHLTVHLVREARYYGPMYLRNQYPFERQMKTYKGYVKNHRRPEGCIAERVLYENVMSFCSEYLGNVKMIGLPTSRHSDRMDGKGTIGHKVVNLSYDKWILAHTYILHNQEEVAPYVKQHMTYLRKNNRKAHEKSLANEHNKTFSTWFKKQVMEDLKDASKCISDRLKSLSYGPNFSASLYSGFVINGCTFYTREQDEHSTMHNSGVTLEAEALHFASAKDKHPVYCKMHYYGVIEETLVNLNKIGHKKDPFILASQAKQVFYVTDPSDKRMSVVISPGSRHIIDDHEGDIAMEEESLIRKVQLEIDDNDESSTYVRNDHGEGMLMAKKRKQRSQSEDNLASDPEDEAFDAKKIRREDERGHTVLAKVGKAIHSGTKIPVEWHPTRNVPRGDNRITLSTYIGVIVRERVSINYKKWSDVPKEMKNEVCEFIMVGISLMQLYAVNLLLWNSEYMLK